MKETFGWGWHPGPDLGLVRLQATVIPHGAPTTQYPNTKTYINDFIKIWLNAFRVIVILQPFYYFYKFFEALLQKKHCFLLLCKSATDDIFMY